MITVSLAARLIPPFEYPMQTVIEYLTVKSGQTTPRVNKLCSVGLKMKNYCLQLFLAACVVCTSAPAAHAAQTTDPTTVFSGLEYELIGTYDQVRLAKVLESELDDFMRSSTMPNAFRGKFVPPRYAVKLYRVKYRSVVPELNNHPTVASGLIAIPDSGETSMPVVSYQHGTVFDKQFVPSNPESSMETRLMIAQFASQGYVVIGADYFGRGVSDLPDSYLVKGSTRQATLDMLIAAKDILDAMKITISHLFVSGWSQGGWVTMQYLNSLDALRVPVSAAAAASAPVDLYLTMNRWVNNPQAVDAVYLPAVVALQLQAQEHYHSQVGLAESAIRTQYLQAARDLYQNKIDWETFFKMTPPKLADFLRPEFSKSGFSGNGPYWHVLESNQAYRWRSDTPLRTYYGGRDEVTPEMIGKLPEQTQILLGGATAQAINAGEQADHRAVFVYSVLDQKPWFDSFIIKK